MAPFRFPAGATLGGKAVGGRFASGAGVRESMYGGARLVSRFPQIIAGLELRCRVATHEQAEEILDDARRRAPVSNRPEYVDADGVRHPGALRDSLYLAEFDLAEDWAVASDLPYAPFVEFGTSKMAAQPFIIPAMEAARGPYIAKVTAACRGL